MAGEDLSSFGEPSGPRTRVEFWIALAATLLINSLFVFATAELKIEGDGSPTQSNSNTMELALQLVDEEPEEEPSQYVEVSPDRMDNLPDETQNFSSRNTQAANPERAEERSEDRSPTLDGRADVGPALDENNQGQRAAPNVPVAQATQPQEARPEQQRQTPSVPPMPLAKAPDFVEQAPEDDEGVASSLERASDGLEVQDNYGDSDIVPLTAIDSPHVREQSESRQQAYQPPTPVTQAQPSPRPRPRVDPQSISGLVRQTQGGVRDTGVLSWDAKMTPFGEYLALMSEPIKNKWHALARSAVQNENGTRVVIKFTLHRDGSVSDVEVSESNARSLTAAVICKDAIENPAPYREWPPEMVARFGDEETFEFGFWYF